MIEAKSFLFINNTFIPINKYKGKLPDKNYIEGAIILNINNVEIINLKMWDLVDQIWAYFINGIIELEEGKKIFEGTFPDQPLYFSFKLDKYNSILVNVDNKIVSLKYNIFVKGIVFYAKSFFKDLFRIEQSLQSKESYFIDKLEFLEQKYGKYNTIS